MGRTGVHDSGDQRWALLVCADLRPRDYLVATKHDVTCGLDPFGNLWWVQTRVEDFDEAEMTRRMSAPTFTAAMEYVQKRGLLSLTIVRVSARACRT